MNELTKYKNGIVLVALYDLHSFPVCTLHSILKNKGFNVTSLFFKNFDMRINGMTYPTKAEMDCFVKTIKDIRPSLVGISVRSVLFKLAAELTRRVKNEVNTTVLWGGTHVISRPEQCLQHADIVCLGEGEEAIVELASRLSLNQPIDCIRNLWIKNEKGGQRNEIGPLIHDMDTIPFPDFSDTDKFYLEYGRVNAYPEANQMGSYPIMTSRGCPYNCTYCGNNISRRVYKDKGPYIRRRSVQNVLSELIEAKKRFPRLQMISFEDDVFTIDLEWIKRFCSQYKELVGLPFNFLCHPNCVTEPLIRLLKDAGAFRGGMGIQSGSPRIRREAYGRHESNEEILNAARILHRYGIKCCFDIIVENPLESEADKQMTFDLLASLPRPFLILPDKLFHLPGSDLTKMLLEKKLIAEDDVEDIKQSFFGRTSWSLDLTRKKEDLYWDNLFFLFAFTWLSTETIVKISKVKLFKKYPRIFMKLLILVRAVSWDVKRALWILPRFMKRLKRWTIK